MKKILFLLLTFFAFSNCFAAFEIKPVTKKANEIFLPVGDRHISLQDLSVISIKDFQAISGKHLNFIGRIAFKAAQKKLRNSINADGTLNNKKLAKALENNNSGNFDTIGFLLGLVLGWIGVILAYLLKEEQGIKKNRIKWAWIGFGAQIILALLIVIIIAGSHFR